MPEPKPEGSPLTGKPSPGLASRVCQDCKEDISARHRNCLRCVDCQKAKDKAVLAQSNQEVQRRRQEKFGANLVKCPDCDRKFATGGGMQVHQRRSHSDSPAPTKGDEPVLPEYTPTDFDELVEKLLKERGFGGKGHTLSGADIVLAYIDTMIIVVTEVTEVTEAIHPEAQKDLAALCRIRELLADTQDEEQN